MRRAARGFGALAFVAVFAGACAPEEIVAARATASGGGGAGGSNDASGTGGDGGNNGGAGTAGTGPACASNDDCEFEEYCAKPSCTAPLGNCEARPAACPGEFDPACGCDNVTYFSDCRRRANGVGLLAHRECPNFSCGGPEVAACPDGSYCSLLLPPAREGPGPACPDDARGRCWVLPTTCAGSPMGVDLWNPCNGMGMCIDTCSAIRSQLPHVPAMRCP